MGNNLLLQINDLIISSGSNALAHIPSLTLERGISHGIIGESGSGKSLTLLSIVDLLPPGLKASGSILFQAEKTTQNLLSIPYIYMRALRGKKIGMIFQEPLSALNPQRTCGWQLNESLAVHAVYNKQDAMNICLAALAEVGIENPERVYNSYPHQISGGQRQRVMIAMATIHKPELVLADEPTTALDPKTAETVLDLLVKRCKDLNAALILVSHDINAVARYCSQITVMQKGHVLANGKTDEILNKESRHPYVDELLKAQPRGKRNPVQKADPDFSAAGISKTYQSSGNKHKALNDVSFTLSPGESLAVLGYSGSGKTTLAKVLTGLEKADSGEVVFNGKKLPNQPPTPVNMVFQDPYSSLNTEQTNALSVIEVLMHKGIHGPEAVNRCKDLFKQTGLQDDLLYKYPHNLSGGQRQRLCIARALAAEPDILILDEAVAALDPIVQKQVLDLLIKIQESTKIRYIFITHNPDAARYLCHKYLKLQAGICIESGVY